MNAMPMCLLAGLLLSAMTQAGVASDAKPANAEFQERSGGYLVSSAFSEDANRPGVIHPPASLSADDLLWIRPLRLNSDEYLILQKCVDPECGKAQVVRAWNAYGYMGPYPVLSNKVSVQAGVRYMLWMQRVPTKGNDSFMLIQPDAPPLIFEPAGSQQLFRATDLEAARQHGPAHIKRAQRDGADFIVTFEGGSVVRMRALRAVHP